jgi:thiosulfate reductase cytochrome b subunit
MGTQMPEDSEIPDIPMEGSGQMAPAETVKPIAGAADAMAETGSKAVPVAAKDYATKDVAADTATVARAADVPEPSSVAVEAEGHTKTPPAAATIRLEKKHPLAIRWMHWVNFPVLFTMIWSGLLIYWNDSDNAYQHPHAVYRVGVGSLTLARMFPPWFWKAIHAPYRVTEGLGYHFFFMWLFAINGILYVAYLLISGEWRLLVPERRSIRDAIQVTLVDLHLRKGLPPQKKYNGAQRIAYSAVISMGLGSLVTGLSIYKPTQVHWVTTLLGGYEMARWEHFWLTMGFCVFFVVHVVQVVLAGWNNFRSMVSGYEIVPAAKVSQEEERSAR